MSVTLKHEVGSKVLIIRVSEKLEKADYKRLLPELQLAIINNKNIRILFIMEDFVGEDPSALWKEIKSDFKYFTDVERLAMVGEMSWEQAMATACEPFTNADIRYFNTEHKHDAVEWLYEGMQVSPEHSSAIEGESK